MILKAMGVVLVSLLALLVLVTAVAGGLVLLESCAPSLAKVFDTYGTFMAALVAVPPAALAGFAIIITAREQAAQEREKEESQARAIVVSVSSDVHRMAVALQARIRTLRASVISGHAEQLAKQDIPEARQAVDSTLDACNRSRNSLAQIPAIHQAIPLGSISLIEAVARQYRLLVNYVDDRNKEGVPPSHGALKLDDADSGLAQALRMLHAITISSGDWTSPEVREVARSRSG
jgi:hypothetical protein